MAVSQELQFFFAKIFDGFWLLEKIVTVLSIIVLCHGVRWETRKLPKYFASFVILTLVLVLSNILNLMVMPREWFRALGLVILGMVLGVHLWFGTHMRRSQLMILWCSMFACVTCVSAIAWEGAYLIAGWLNMAELEPILRVLISFANLPCALYLRACDFGEFESVPRGGIVSIVVCDIGLMCLSAVESVWVFTDYPVTVVMVVVYGCMLMVVISIIHAMHHMCREQEERVELQAERQRLLSEREVAGMVASNIDDLRCLRHELKNQYAYMNILLRENRYSELAEYFNQMSENLPPLLGLANSGNRSIDTVLNMELTKAKQAFVPVEYDLIAPAELPFSADDLCAILANLMDNAIEECVRLRVLGREDVFVRLSIQPYGSYLYIVCRNSTDRLDLERWHDALRTTKSDERLHGYGTRIVMKLAQKYNGTADFSLKEGVFVAKVMLDTMEGEP